MKLVDCVKTDVEEYISGHHNEILFNERDFQIHLAMYLKCTGHYDDVDLEYYVPSDQLNGYRDLWNSELRLDILIRKGDEFLPIELKYKTKCIHDILNRFNESIPNILVVKNHGAQDLGMYDFWKDVKRVEMVRERFCAVKNGLSVFLTNDESYTKNPRCNSNNKEFRMIEGYNSPAKHWQRDTSTTKGRPNFDLSNGYDIHWKSAIFGEHQFQYCIVEI